MWWWVGGESQVESERTSVVSAGEPRPDLTREEMIKRLLLLLAYTAHMLNSKPKPHINQINHSVNLLQEPINQSFNVHMNFSAIHSLLFVYTCVSLGA